VDQNARHPISEDAVGAIWHVQYRRDTVECILRYHSPEDAIESACRLIDDGCDVYALGTGPVTDSIERDLIDRIYAMWARARYPFGLLPTRRTAR
jgi:hypothetical protein